MIILGNIGLTLALLLYVMPLQFILHDAAATKRNDGGLIWGAIYVFLPFWILMMAALCAVVSQGGLDWLRGGRGLQYLATVVTCVAMFLVTILSMIGKYEPPSQMPWVIQWFTGWGLYAFPLVALAFGFLALNPALAATVPPLAYRVPMAVVGGLSLLVMICLLGGWFVQSQKRQAARIERVVAEASERDRNILERLKTLDPDKNFPELLGFANRFEEEPIRKVAIEKARSHPQFISELAAVLQNGWAEKGLVYLDGCEVSEAEMKTLAEPVRKAIGVLTESAKENIVQTHTPYPDQFDWNTRIILSVADKFKNSGVDYVPAIRDYRAALETTRVAKNFFNAPRTLDQWLVQRAKATR